MMDAETPDTETPNTEAPEATPQIREPFARGSLTMGMAGGEQLRWAVADMTEMIQAARDRLDLSPLAAAALGRTMAGSVLLLRMATKTSSRLMVEVRGDGLLKQVVADADRDGSVRGMVSNALVSLPPTSAGKLDVGGAIGGGILRVTRARGGKAYSSQVELVSGEIGDDLAHYLEQSEQTRSAVPVGVLTRTEGVAAAGGMIIEALPQASDAVITQLERNLNAITQAQGGISRVLEAEGREGVVSSFLAGLEPRQTEERELAYRCRCSRERLKQHLVLLSEEDKQSLYDDGKVTAECSFCGEVYVFEDLS